MQHTPSSAGDLIANLVFGAAALHPERTVALERVGGTTGPHTLRLSAASPWATVRRCVNDFFRPFSVGFCVEDVDVDDDDLMSAVASETVLVYVGHDRSDADSRIATVGLDRFRVELDGDFAVNVIPESYSVILSS